MKVRNKCLVFVYNDAITTCFASTLLQFSVVGVNLRFKLKPRVSGILEIQK